MFLQSLRRTLLSFSAKILLTHTGPACGSESSQHCVASFSNFCCVSDSLISFFRSKERQQFLAIFVTFLNLDYSGNWRDFRYTLLGYPMSVETLLPHFDVPFTPAPFSDKYILPKLTCKKTNLHCLLWQLILTIGLLMCSCTSLALLPVLLLKTALS